MKETFSMSRITLAENCCDASWKHSEKLGEFFEYFLCFQIKISRANAVYDQNPCFDYELMAFLVVDSWLYL
jgi:hypothetical protein